MTHNTNTKWLGNMAFESEVEGYKIVIDAKEEFGGEGLGPTPKPLLLMSLAGCTGMDVASLLKKMRLEVNDFDVNVSGELTEEHPKHYSDIHIEYLFKGKNLDKEKLEKAVNLSQERYCGVHFMLKQAAKITHNIEYIETK
jgi:putative redox protein